MTARHFLLTATIIAASTLLTAAAQSTATDSPVLTSLSSANSSVIIVADSALLDRAFTQQEAQAEETVSDEESATPAAEQEKTVKSRTGKTAGYRVQVFADNNARTAKGEARARERSVASVFPHYATYVAYSSPYWRLRVGDFRNQAEADKAAAEIRRAFPGYAKEVRVVRDHINAR